MSAEYESNLLTSARAEFESEYDREIEHERDMFDEVCETLDY